MSSYTGTANRPDRAKAIVAVIAVHAAIAAVILTGLNVRTVSQVVEHLQTFDIRPPPPPKPPPPAPKPHLAKHEAGAPAKRAEATQVVAPKPKLPVQSPIPAAPIAGQGSAPSSGAASAGTGTGAGGSGNGPGGGGDYSKFTPAQQIRGIPDREYRRLAASGIPSGSVGITMRVNHDGTVSNCRIARSSGSNYADATMCELATNHVRFRPARDPSGRAIAQDITWYPRWWKP